MKSQTLDLSPATLETYGREGFLVCESVIDRSEVEEAREAISMIIRSVHASLLRGSPDVEIQPTPADARANYAGLEVKRVGSEFRLRFEAGTDPRRMGPEEAEKSVRVLYSYRDEHPVFRRLIDHPNVRGVVEHLVGPGAILFQDMALIKPPYIGSEKPWHQDDAYFSYAPLERIVGVWIALDEARAENGCMHVIPGGHRNSGLRHFHSSLDCEIVPGRISAQQAVPIELPPGGALFFSGLLPHQTPVNRSPLRRRAVQFHYRGADTVKLEAGDYDRVFVDPDGMPASCKAAPKGR